VAHNPLLFSLLFYLFSRRLPALFSLFPPMSSFSLRFSGPASAGSAEVRHPLFPLANSVSPYGSFLRPGPICADPSPLDFPPSDDGPPPLSTPLSPPFGHLLGDTSPPPPWNFLQPFPNHLSWMGRRRVNDEMWRQVITSHTSVGVAISLFPHGRNPFLTLHPAMPPHL